MQNYIELAQRTKSDKFYASKVPLGDLQMVLQLAITNLQWLDKIKKALFYGREYSATTQNNRFDVSYAVEFLAIGLANTKGEASEQDALDILHAILGKATEAGELLESLQDVCNGGRFDPVNFREEIGDGFWYDAIGLAALGDSDFALSQRVNIAKLQERFPGKFTEAGANVRDLPNERLTLEQVSESPEVLEIQRIGSSPLRVPVDDICNRKEPINASTVYEAIGAASMCWSPKPTGVFDSTAATQVAKNLCDKLGL